MEITLRRASQIESQVRSLIQTTSQRATSTLSVYESDLISALDDARTQWERQMEYAERLEDIAYDIRGQIGAKNAAIGIDALLTEKAKLENRVRRLADALSVPGRDTNEVIAGRINTARTRLAGDNGAYQAEELTTSLLTEEEIDSHKSHLNQIRRRIAEIRDRLLELNVGTRITLDETTVGVLKAAQIV